MAININASRGFDEPDFDLAAFDRMMLVNVQCIAPMLRDEGRIITVGTSGVHMGRFVGSAGYVGAKSALTGFTRGWARDFGPRGITANLIQPGPIVAGVVSFLAGPDAAYLTGVSLLVDGGQRA